MLASASVIFAWVLLETASLGVYYWIHCKPFSRAEVLARLTVDRLSHNPQRGTLRLPVPSHVANKVLHPYLGFVVDPAHPLSNELGFYGDQPVLKRSQDKIIVGLFGGSLALGLTSSHPETPVFWGLGKFVESSIEATGVAFGVHSTKGA